jgi:hypothetical protein
MVRSGRGESGRMRQAFREVARRGNDESRRLRPVSAQPRRCRAYLRWSLHNLVCRPSPWKDLTAAILAELRFDSIAGWLMTKLTRCALSFKHKMNRLYAIAEEDEPR